jgi:hypothetical protein
LPLDAPVQVLASRRINKLPGGGTLIAEANLEFTNDVISAGASTPARRDVAVATSLILADSPAATAGITLTPASRRVITWREHHVTVTPKRTYRVPARLAGRMMYVNVVGRASAHPLPQACSSPGSGRLTPCALTFERSISQLEVFGAPLGAARVTPAAEAPVPEVSLPSAASGTAAYGKRTPIWSSTALNLAAGDVVEVDARLVVSASSLDSGLALPAGQTTGCNALFTGQLYLMTSPGAMPGAYAPALTGDTGFNLTQATPVAPWVSRGMLQAASADGGRRYVVLLAWSARSAACPAGDVDVVGGRSGISVRIHQGAARR